MKRLFEGFQIFFTDLLIIFLEKGGGIQGRTLYKRGNYSRKYGRYMYVVVVMPLYRFDYTHIPIPAVGH